MNKRVWLIEAKKLLDGLELEQTERLSPVGRAELITLVATAMKSGYNQGWEDFAEHLSDQLRLEDEQARKLAGFTQAKEEPHGEHE